MATKKEVESQLESSKKLLETIREINKEENIQKEVKEELLKIEKEVAKGLRDELSSYERRAIKSKKEYEINVNSVKKLQEKIDLLKELEISDRNQEESRKNQLEALQKQLKLLEKQTEKLEKLNELDEKRNSIHKESEDLVGSIGAKLGIARDISNTWVGSLNRALQTSGGLRAAFDGLISGIKKTFTIDKIIESVTTKIAESTKNMVLRFSDAAAEINKTLGAGGKYDKMLDNLRAKNLSFGVGLNETAQAIKTLGSGLSSYADLSEDARNNVTEMTAKFDKLGISMGDTTQFLETATKSFRMTAEEGTKSISEVSAMADKLGMPIGKLVNDLNTSAPQLAAYGKRAVDVFKNIAIQSKATGIEASKLIGIAKQFDTFEGAAQAAGKLNAMLGGPYLNSVELLAAEEGDRIEMLQESIKLSGKNWESLNRFERMAIATAAGISDINEANKIFNAESEKYRDAVNKNGMSTERMKEIAEKSTSVTEKMSLIMQSFAVAVGPIVDGISSLLQGFLELSDAARGTILVIFSIITVMFLLAKVIAAVITPWKLISSLIKKSGDEAKVAGSKIGEGLAEGVDKVGSAATTNAKGLLAFGGAILMIGAGIGIAAFGMAQFVSAFQGLNAEQISGVIQGMLILGATIVGLALIAKLAAIEVAILGFGILEIGLGIGIAAAGVALLITSFSSLLEVITKMGESKDLATNLDSMATSLVGLLAASVSGGLAFLAIAGGITLMAAALAVIKTRDLEALATFSKSISELKADSIISITKAFTELSKAIKEIGQISDEEINKTVNVIQKTVSAMTPSVPSPITRPAPSVVGSNAQTVNPAISGANIAAKTGNTTVILQLDRRELGKVIIDLFNQNTKLNTNLTTT